MMAHGHVGLATDKVQDQGHSKPALEDTDPENSFFLILGAGIGGISMPSLN